MSETYSIQKDVLNTIFKKVISDGAFKNELNADHVQEILLTNLEENQIETIIHLLLMEDEYKKLKIGDYVLVKPPSYHAGSEYEPDILTDIGLLPHKPGYVFGIVTGDSSWSSNKPFQPFYSKIKVDLLYHDGEKKLKKLEYEAAPMHCIKYNKANIIYYRRKADKVVMYNDMVKEEIKQKAENKEKLLKSENHA
tara:strand:+ start:907 stop:1491 length:585 start_codon:yes stop_codon:yes gene_type:complete